MKIAVPVTSNHSIDEHFGHCEMYMVFTISEEFKITHIEELDSPQGCGCKSNIAVVLAKKGVSVMLAGGIGAGAINVLNSVGIEVVRGCSGDAAQNVLDYLKGTIVDSGSSCEQHDHHHGEDGGHQCSH